MRQILRLGLGAALWKLHHKDKIWANVILHMTLKEENDIFFLNCDVKCITVVEKSCVIVSG